MAGEKNIVACSVTTEPHKWKLEYLKKKHRTAAVNASFSYIRKG